MTDLLDAAARLRRPRVARVPAATRDKRPLTADGLKDGNHQPRPDTRLVEPLAGRQHRDRHRWRLRCARPRRAGPLRRGRRHPLRGPDVARTDGRHARPRRWRPHLLRADPVLGTAWAPPASTGAARRLRRRATVGAPERRAVRVGNRVRRPTSAPTTRSRPSPDGCSASLTRHTGSTVRAQVPELGGRSSAYGRQALDAEAGKVALAPEGRRNDQLNRSAFAVGQLVAAGHLDQIEAVQALCAAADRAGLGQQRPTRTIKQRHEPWPSVAQAVASMSDETTPASPR